MVARTDAFRFGKVRLMGRRLKVATGFHAETVYADNERYEVPVIDYEDVTADVAFAVVGALMAVALAALVAMDAL